MVQPLWVPQMPMHAPESQMEQLGAVQVTVQQVLVLALARVLVLVLVLVSPAQR